MDWLTKITSTGLQAASSGLQAAQRAASDFVPADAAERARALAQEAGRYAQEASLKAQEVAKEATLKAQEVAKEAFNEAVSEAERGVQAMQAITGRAQGAPAEPAAEPSPDPLAYGITPDLRQFVGSLTYATFSDFPLETLPSAPGNPGSPSARLTPWQETHARLMLEAVPQLESLRFVLCPRRLEEYTFWRIYFTLCRRYLPAGASAPGGSAGVKGGAAAAAEVAAAAAVASAAAVAAAAAGDGEADAPDGGSEAGGGGGSDELGGIVADPELDAYLEEALGLDDGDGEGGASDVGDLDDYLNALDAEVGGEGEEEKEKE